MVPRMLPPSDPGGQPGAPMPTKARKRKSSKPKFQAAPRGAGGFGVQAPQAFKAGGLTK